MGSPFTRLRLYGIAFFLTSSVYAADLEPVTISDFSPGLHTTQDSAYIPNGAAQDLQNVDVWRGRLQKRRGSVLQNSTPLTGNQAVRFLHEFPDSAGNFWLISVSSNTVFRSRDAGATNSVLTSTHGVTASSDFQAINAFGKVRLTDGTTNWILFDGTNVSVSTASPKGRLAEFAFDRVFTADISGDRSTLYASRSADPEDWTDNNVEDADAFSSTIRKDNGYPIRALKRFKNSLLVFKDYSIDALTMAPDGLTPVVTPVSSTKGTQHPRSIQAVLNDVIFLADDGYYKYDGVGIQKISGAIDATALSIRQLNSAQRSLTLTSQSDWSGGTLGTDLSLTASVDDVAFSSGGIVVDDFSDGNYTANPAWTVGDINTNSAVESHSGNMVFRSSNTGIGGSNNVRLYTANSHNAGSWSVQLKTNETANTDFRVAICTTTPVQDGLAGCYAALFTNSVNQAGLYINGSLSGSAVTLPSAPFSTSYRTFRLERSTAGVLTVWYEGSKVITQTNTTFTTFPFLSLRMSFNSAAANEDWAHIDNINFKALESTYTYAGLSIGQSITSWGAVTINATDDGATQAFTLYVDTNTSFTATSAATFVASQTVANNTVPTISTGAFVHFTDRFSRIESTQSPKLSDITINWNEGSSNFPVASLVFNGDYFCAVAIDSTSVNETILVHDRNGAWTKYKGLYPYSVGLYRQYPYYGSATQGSIYRFQADNTYADNGTAINAYWVSKDFNFGYPVSEKVMQRYYVTAQRNTTSNATFEYGVNRGSLTSSTLDLDLTPGFFRQIIKPASLTYQRGIEHRFKLSNSTANEYFDILSITLVPRLESAP
jgi:hypothetical protein